MRDKLQSLLFRAARKTVSMLAPTAGEFPLAYYPQEHEQALVEYFQQEGHRFLDGPLEPATKTNVAICFVNRCGSNWLAALLAATDLIGHAEEIFNAPRFTKVCKNNEIRSFSEGIFVHATAKTDHKPDTFITKLSWDQLYFLSKFRIIPEMLPNTKFILMHRRNKAAQALSLLVAQQTGQWTSQYNSGKNGKRDLDAISDTDITHVIGSIVERYKSFHQYFATFGITPIEIYYEDITENPEREITRLVEALNLNPDGKEWQLDESKVKIKKQSDTEAEKRVALYHKNIQNHHAATLDKKEEQAA